METVRVTDLPVEVIRLILKSLPYPDLQDARLVCQKFYEASLGACLFDRERVVFNDKGYPLNEANVMHSKRDFLHIRLEYIDPVAMPKFSYEETVWSHIGPNLKSLHLVQCFIKDRHLMGVLRQCPKLSHLEISACRVGMSPDEDPQYRDDYPHPFWVNEEDDYFEESRFENLLAPLKLNLESFSVVDRLDPRLFWKILKNSPNLKSLSVEGFLDPEDDTEISHRFLPLTTDHVFDYIKDHGHHLLDLRLIIDTERSENIQRAEQNLSNALLKAKNLQLRKFETNVSLSDEFFLNQKSCQQMTLKYDSHDSLGIISRELQDLKNLDLFFVYHSVSDMKTVMSLKNLNSLHVSYFPCIAHVIDSDVCGDEINTNLQTLELFDSTRSIEVTPGFVSQLAKTHLALTHLNLGGCRGVTDASVQSIFEHLVLLKSLKLVECPGLSDAGLKGSPETISSNDGTGYSIARLKRLRTLDLSRCKITGECFTNGVQFPDLRHLSLSSIKDISRDNVVLFIENNRTIERLELNGSVKFSDEFVGVIMKNLWRLRHINIGKKSEISKAGMELLKKSCRSVVKE